MLSLSRFLRFMAFMALFALAACSESDSFSVEGKLSDGSTINMRAIYYDGDKLQNAIFPTDKGKFSFRAPVSKGTVVELLTNDYRLLGRFYAAPGDELSVTVNPKSPYRISVSGNDVAVRWSNFLNENAKVFDSKNPADINALVEKYVKAHPDDLVSTLLVITSYDAAVNPKGAEKLLAAIKSEARPEYLVSGFTLSLARVGSEASKQRVVPFSFIDAADSLAYFNPARQKRALLIFTNDVTGRPDSIRDAMHRLASRNSDPHSLRVLDFSLDYDTISWHRQLREDSLIVRVKNTGSPYERPPLPRTSDGDILVHGWAAGSVAATAVERLGIPSLPFFIVVDSTGTQLYRGSEISPALKLVR